MDTDFPSPIPSSLFRLLLLGVLLVLSVGNVHAHGGRTDRQGGHHDRIHGGYHFHHGREAHPHPNGICLLGPRAESSTEKVGWKGEFKDGEDSPVEQEGMDNALWWLLGGGVLGMGLYRVLGLGKGK